MGYKHKHGHKSPFPYCDEEKKITQKRQEYAAEALHEEEEAAARVAIRGHQNPKVKGVSLWSLRNKRISE